MAAAAGNGGGSTTALEMAAEKKNHFGGGYEVVREVARSNAVVVFSMSGCCMCTVVKRLLFGLGVGPTIVELDHLPSSDDIQTVLSRLHGSNNGGGGGGSGTVPAVFIGGKFLGGIETLMACHINGSLVPLLKDAGALCWSRIIDVQQKYVPPILKHHKISWISNQLIEFPPILTPTTNLVHMEISWGFN